MRSIIAIALVVGAMPLGAQTIASRISASSERDLLTALVAAEDSRRPVSRDDPRTRGLASGNAYIRAFTVRGLGRLEQPAMARLIEPLLRDGSSEVRAAAANALAQAVARPLAASATADMRAWHAQQVASVRSSLTTRLDGETDPSVRASLLESLGRLAPYSSDQVKATADQIAPSLSASSIVERRGAIRAIFFLARKREARAAGAIPASVTDKLHAMLVERATSGLSSTDRFNIAFALNGVMALTEAHSERLIADRDAYVRDRAIVALGRSSNVPLIRRLVMTAFADPEPVVRFRAMNVYAQKLRASDGCGPLIALTRDQNMNVALGAADALSGCRGDTVVAGHLATLASQLADDDRWHLPAHAFVSLSVVDSARAGPMLPRYMEARNFFVRMYADSAARLLRDVTSLYQLSRDPHPNVRASAIGGLSSLVGHAADSVYVAALSSDDNQLLMAAAAALKGSSWPGLAKIVEDRRSAREGAGGATAARQTDRDGNEALATLHEALTASRVFINVRPERMVLPTFAEMAALETATARIDMMDGSVITIRLHPFDAPTNAHRFARLARAGVFDGLTFHRVAPFFVVQGPGPYANEYSAPDKPFARDELALSNVRGSVGLSTRGRDTGDGQIYVNTVDNIWLDHDYTVMATVTSGLEAFDRMQEGARIRRVTITP